jgi:hypothetical protein
MKKGTNNQIRKLNLPKTFSEYEVELCRISKEVIEIVNADALDYLRISELANYLGEMLPPLEEVKVVKRDVTDISQEDSLDFCRVSEIIEQISDILSQLESLLKIKNAC